MKLIGLTGGVASGKSTVAQMFSDLGAKVIDTDTIARKVVEPGLQAYQDIVEYFGNTILDKHGIINREKLGALVFSDEKARKKLEEITHPRIGDELQKEIQKFHRAPTKGGSETKILLIEAPLLVEAGMHSWLRPFIVVYASMDIQIERLVKRNGLSKEDAVKRILSQIPLKEKAKLADYTVDNSGTLDNTRHQVYVIWEEVIGQK